MSRRKRARRARAQGRESKRVQGRESKGVQGREGKGVQGREGKGVQGREGKGMSRRNVMLVAAVLVVAGGIWWLRSGGGTADGPRIAVSVPTFSAKARIGEQAFNKWCKACHGANAAGTSKGPPFIHRFYVPNHHGDGAFRIAPRRGVRAHHWRFGDMPIITGVSNGEIEGIITYVRELQRANGIY